MQDYIQLAEKNNVILIDKGPCQFCGAITQRGVHECLEIFNTGFQNIDYAQAKNHLYRFLIVDAHALQHSEIHGRWSNHFHLTRLHLIFKYNVKWSYELSPKLSDTLNKYKCDKLDEFLIPPGILQRGKLTTTDILDKASNENEYKDLIKKWALEVYTAWNKSHTLIDSIALKF